MQSINALLQTVDLNPEWEWARNDGIKKPLVDAKEAVSIYEKASSFAQEFLAFNNHKTLKTSLGDVKFNNACKDLVDGLDPLLDKLNLQGRILIGYRTTRQNAATSKA